MIRTFDEAQGLLAEMLPGYEERIQQVAFAHEVEAALANGEHLIAEAGCGTGKSLGYGIPAVIWARANRKRVIISTATKALQDQVANKDLPFMADNLGIEFDFAVVKGRSNYVCLAKCREADPGEVRCLPQVFSTIERKSRSQAEDPKDFDPAFLAERHQFDFDIEDVEWGRITATSDDCPGRSECDYGDQCFAEEAKRRGRAADIVVVNHALLLTDMAVSEATEGLVTMLGTYEALVIDEAHEFESYASNALGAQFTEGSISKLVTDVLSFSRRVEDTEAIEDACDRVTANVADLWQTLEIGLIRMATIQASQEEYVRLVEGLYELTNVVYGQSLEAVEGARDFDKIRLRRDRLGRRARRVADRFATVVMASDDEVVRWVEEERVRNPRGGPQTRRVIKASPLHVGDYLREHLFAVVPTTMVSATMKVGGSFDYLAGRLGVDRYRSIDVGTPFDFTRQARLFIPRSIPEPTQKNREAWSVESIDLTERLVLASRGRALLLFTSYAQMQEAYRVLSKTLPFTCLVQGSAPNKVLADRFKADVSSVLFATRSFFTGVDFQGETLSLVVIDKLPWGVPTEPLYAARSEAIERAGGNAFSQYAIPEMILPLMQGFGRLIRSLTDRGVFALLDPRVLTKGYGKAVLRSLPAAPRVETVEEVEEFFAREEAAA